MSSANSLGLAGLIIDMQSEFLKNIEEKGRGNMIQSQIGLIHYLSEREVPIFVLEYEGRGKTIEVITKEIDFSKNEKPLTKRTDGGFDNTELHARLKKHRSKNLILMGINATSCVQFTAEGALSRKYKIYTAKTLIAEKEKYKDREMEQKIESLYTRLGKFFKTGKELISFLESQR
jgi:nicotinamidase-related amidase